LAEETAAHGRLNSSGFSTSDTKLRWKVGFVNAIEENNSSSSATAGKEIATRLFFGRIRWRVKAEGVLFTTLRDPMATPIADTTFWQKSRLGVILNEVSASVRAMWREVED
jgi:hypothetical protein